MRSGGLILRSWTSSSTILPQEAAGQAHVGLPSLSLTCRAVVMVDTAEGNSSQNFCLGLAVAHASGGVAAEHEKTARRRFLCTALMID
jgi:hypothetical protein